MFYRNCKLLIFECKTDQFSKYATRVVIYNYNLFCGICMVQRCKLNSKCVNQALVSKFCCHGKVSCTRSTFLAYYIEVCYKPTTGFTSVIYWTFNWHLKKYVFLDNYTPVGFSLLLCLIIFVQTLESHSVSAKTLTTGSIFSEWWYTLYSFWVTNCRVEVL